MTQQMMFTFAACAAGFLSVIIASMMRLRHSEAFGMAVLIGISMPLSREYVMAYTVAAAVSMYLADYMQKGCPVRKTKKAVLAYLFCAVIGIFVSVYGMKVSMLAIKMRSGGIIIALAAFMVIYLIFQRKGRAEAVTGVFAGVCLFFVLKSVGAYTGFSATDDNGFWTTMSGLLLLSRTYAGNLFSEADGGRFRSVMVSVPLLFFSAVPIDYVSAIFLSVMFSSNITYGVYLGIGGTSFTDAFQTAFIFSAVLTGAVLVFMCRVKRLPRLPEQVIRFGRPFVIILVLAIMQYRGNQFHDYLLLVFVTLLGFLLNREGIAPEHVFMGYSICSMADYFVAKVHIFAQDQGLLSYLGSIPLTGYSAIAVLTCVSAVVGYLVSRYRD